METGPILVHVVTEKGKGYAPAEAAPRSTTPWSSSMSPPAHKAKSKPNAPARPERIRPEPGQGSPRATKIIAITAAMPSGTGVDLFNKAFPDRTFDVGIAEQHAVTFAAGLATEGFKPFCAIYSTFLQRGYRPGGARRRHPEPAGRGSPSTARASSAPTAPPTPARSTTPISAACPTSSSWRPPTRPSWCTWWRRRAHRRRPERAAAIRAATVSASSCRRAACPRRSARAASCARVRKIACLSFGARLQKALKAARGARSAGPVDHRRRRPLRQAPRRRSHPTLAREHEVLITIEEGAIGGFGAHVMQVSGRGWHARPRLADPRDGAARRLPRPRLAEPDVCQRRPRCQGHRDEGVRDARQGFKVETVDRPRCSTTASFVIARRTLSAERAFGRGGCDEEIELALSDYGNCLASLAMTGKRNEIISPVPTYPARCHRYRTAQGRRRPTPRPDPDWIRWTQHRPGRADAALRIFRSATKP